MQLRKKLGLLCHGSTLLARVQLVHQQPHIHLCKAAFQTVDVSMYWCKRLFQARCRTWHFAFVELHKVPDSSFLQPVNMFLNDSTIL